MQLGFVIDHSKCIGCHACTVACKSENDVPLGAFRTWVKYTEEGTFPSVRRSFAVLRCNQCTDAPCVTICPVRALAKRPDGIVDVDPAACIGCKACMQGCPYDALYLNEDSGTAEKCHFCAHRVERGLAPACAVVCPTEAIIPGDFHDRTSVVSHLRAEHDLVARKVEAGTGPNVLYREVGPAGIDPLLTTGAGGYLWAQRLTGPALDAERFDATMHEAERRARTTYSVDHPARWGGRVSSYLFTKSLAAGLLPAAFLVATQAPHAAGWLGSAALALLALTTVLLVADLKRPERFLYILLRPNWDSWLARGALILMAYGAVATGWTALAFLGALSPKPRVTLGLAGTLLGALTAAYTGWLFAQAKGRVLWLRRGLWLHLIVQAGVAGSASALVMAPWLGLPPQALGTLRLALGAALLLHGALALAEPSLAPARREKEYHRVARLVTQGPFASHHWTLGLGAGVLGALVLLLVPLAVAWYAAAALALAGLWVEEDILVRAGQALPIS